MPLKKPDVKEKRWVSCTGEDNHDRVQYHVTRDNKAKTYTLALVVCQRILLWTHGIAVHCYTRGAVHFKY